MLLQLRMKDFRKKKLHLFIRSHEVTSSSSDDVTGQSDFCIPKKNRNTVRSIESVYTPT